MELPTKNFVSKEVFSGHFDELPMIPADRKARLKRQTQRNRSQRIRKSCWNVWSSDVLSSNAEVRHLKPGNPPHHMMQRSLTSTRRACCQLPSLQGNLRCPDEDESNTKVGCVSAVEDGTGRRLAALRHLAIERLPTRLHSSRCVRR